MATIRIPNVELKLKNDLKKKAIDENMSMQDYLVKIIKDAIYKK